MSLQIGEGPRARCTSKCRSTSGGSEARNSSSSVRTLFDQDSTFGGICELLGYDEAEFRSKVATCLGERADVLQRAEAFLDAIGFGDSRY